MINLTRVKDPIIPEVGIYYDVPFATYRSWSCMSKSLVMPALKSHLKLKGAIHKNYDSPAILLGSVTDCLVLEPELFDDYFIIQPSTYDKLVTKGRAPNKITTIEKKKWSGNSKTCKEFIAKHANSGKTLISEKVYKQAGSLTKAILANPENANDLKNGQKQISLCWKDKETGILCKARLDLKHGSRIIDLKTTVDCALEAFQKTCQNFGYHIQSYAYSRGWEQLTGECLDWRFMTAETEETGQIPETKNYDTDYDSTFNVIGGEFWHKALRKVATYDDNDIKGYSPEAEEISLQQWYINKALNEAES